MPQRVRSDRSRALPRRGTVVIGLAAFLWASSSIAAPPEGGTISLEPKTSNGEHDPTLVTFINAATEALATKGFTVLDDVGHAQYVGELVLSRSDVGTGTAKVAPGKSSVMPGYSPGVGAGVAIPLPSGNSRLVPIQRIQIELHIHKRGETEMLWNGAAVTIRESGTRRGAPEAVAADLSEALLRSYPAEAGQVVGVP